MTLRVPGQEDWQRFFRLVEEEGWRVPQVERQLFMGRWADAALVLELQARFCGLVTAVAHQRSGWIGNLIVPAELRGAGYGSTLFCAALDGLKELGLESIWLTASALGRSLYAKHGFVVVDRIERWVLPSGVSRIEAVDVATVSAAALLAADREAWGEQRQVLLEEVVQTGQVFACGGSIALLQREPGLQIVGPWYANTVDSVSSWRLLQAVLDTADADLDVVIDLLVSSPVRSLLPEAGLHKRGENLLMVQGDDSAVARDQMVALASLGSVG